MAMVAFIRAAHIGAAGVARITDHTGAFIGDSLHQSHFAVQLPPGERLFVSWGENTGALVADLKRRARLQRAGERQ